MRDQADVSAEYSALRGLVEDSTLAHATRLTPEMFSSVPRRLIFAAIQDLSSKNLKIDPVTIMDRIDPSHQHVCQDVLIDALSGPGVPANFVAYEAIVCKAWETEQVIQQAKHLMENPEDLDTVLAALTASGGVSRWEYDQSSAIEKAHVLLDKMQAGIAGVSTGFSHLDELTQGLMPGRLTVVGGRPSMGKGHPLDTPILLADGSFKEIGKLRVGDKLASIDGRESVVTGVFDRGELDSYSVSFVDGRSVIVDADHLWTVSSCRWNKNKTISTSRLGEYLSMERYQKRIKTPTHAGEFGSTNTIIDPWVLGALLGDGSFRNSSVRFSSSDPEIIERMGETVFSYYGIIMKYESGWDYRLSCKGGVENGLLSAIRALGLFGKKSEDKYIPEIYFKANRKDRNDLLRGLMDTDGWVQNRGTSCVFSSASDRLAYDVVRLARSLGFSARIGARKNTGYKDENGDLVPGLGERRVYISAPSGDDVFFLKRKASAYKGSMRRANTIASITPCGKKEIRCISVSHDSHLYITSDYIVTHNTAFCTALALNAGCPVGFISSEMSVDQITLRILSMISRVPLSSAMRGMTQDEWTKWNQGVNDLREMPIMINDRPGINIDEVSRQARKWVYNSGIRLLIIDYCQRLGGNPKKDRTENIRNSVQQSKEIARNLDIHVMLLSQVNRGIELRNDKRPLMSDLDGAGTIEAEADHVINLYRPWVYDKSQSKSDVELILAKNRHGPSPETVFAHFDPATTTFSPAEKRNEAPF